MPITLTCLFDGSLRGWAGLCGNRLQCDDAVAGIVAHMVFEIAGLTV